MQFIGYEHRKDCFGFNRFYEDSLQIYREDDFKKTLSWCLRRMKSHPDFTFKVMSENGQQWIVNQPMSGGQYFRVTFSRAWNNADSEREMTRREVIRKIVSWAGKTSEWLSHNAE